MTTTRNKVTTRFTAAILLLVALLLVRVAVLSTPDESTVTPRTEPPVLAANAAIDTSDGTERIYQAYLRADDRHPEAFARHSDMNVSSARDKAGNAPVIVAAAPVVATPEAPPMIESDPATAVSPARPSPVVSAPPIPEPSPPVAEPDPVSTASRTRPSPAGSEPAAAESTPPVAQISRIPSARQVEPREIRVVQNPPIAVVAEPRPTGRWQRLDADGNPVSAQQDWSCVSDNHRDLVWEVKTRDGGLRDAAHLYSWFDPALGERGGARDGGRCSGGIDCDTRAYLAEINRRALCGFSDWRLPSKQELQSLVTFSDSGGASIDLEYFPATAASWYWSASADDSRPGYAWYVLFRNGIPLNDLKTRSKHVRLVRGNRLQLASNP